MITEDRYAAIIHELWCHWMCQLFDKASYDGRGCLTLSAEDSARWWRQAHTLYAQLLPHEQAERRELAGQHFFDQQIPIAIYHTSGRATHVPLYPQPLPILTYEDGRLIGWRLPGRVSIPDVEFDSAGSQLIAAHVLPRCPYTDALPAGPRLSAVRLVRMNQQPVGQLVEDENIELHDQDALLTYASLWNAHYGSLPLCRWEDNPFAWRLEF